MDKKMKEYNVRMPITGFVDMIVKAEDKKGAVAAFWKAVEDIDPYARPDEEGGFNNIEWDYAEKVVEGGVFHGVQNTVEVEEYD